MLGVLSKSLGRRKTPFPGGHAPFLKLVLRYFTLRSDCSYETVVENSDRISACFHLEGSFSRGILLFSCQRSFLSGHTAFLPCLIGKNPWTDFLEVTASMVKFADVTL